MREIQGKYSSRCILTMTCWKWFWACLASLWWFMIWLCATLRFHCCNEMYLSITDLCWCMTSYWRTAPWTAQTKATRPVWHAYAAFWPALGKLYCFMSGNECSLPLRVVWVQKVVQVQSVSRFMSHSCTSQVAWVKTRCFSGYKHHAVPTSVGLRSNEASERTSTINIDGIPTNWRR